MWERVKLSRQKIMENYFKSSRGSPPNVFFSKGVHSSKGVHRKHLGDCFWSFSRADILCAALFVFIIKSKK